MMVRFTLSCRSKGSNLRMEFQDGDRVGDVCDVVAEVLGFDGFSLSNGYALLSPERHVGDCISDGDTVEVIPDPEDDSAW